MIFLCKEDKNAETGGVGYLPVPETTRGLASPRSTFGNWTNSKENQPEWHDSLLFDAVFVDEGQDLEPEEYLLLIRRCKKHKSYLRRGLTRSIL